MVSPVDCLLYSRLLHYDICIYVIVLYLVVHTTLKNAHIQHTQYDTNCVCTGNI